MPNQWTIHHYRGDPDGQDLIGCHIQVSDDGNHYEFTTPDNQVLSTTTESTLPTPPFPFPEFQLPSEPTLNWNIEIDTTTAGKHHDKIEGSWSNGPRIEADESGTFTAQAGQGMDPEVDYNDEGDEDAAAASA